MPRIIGEGILPEAAAFHDVRDAMPEWEDLILFPHIWWVVGEEIPDDASVYNLEPLYEGSRVLQFGYLEVLRKCKVFDYQRQNVVFLQQHGIDAVHMPFGYHPSMERPVRMTRDTDVLFIGSVNERRAEIIEEFERSGLVFRSIQGCYGQERDKMIARARICVNFHYRDDHPLEVVRLNYLLANKCFVISERGWDEEENARYEDALLFVERGQLVDACREMLGTLNIMEAIAERGQRIIRSMPHSVFVEKARGGGKCLG